MGLFSGVTRAVKRVAGGPLKYAINPAIAVDPLSNAAVRAGGKILPGKASGGDQMVSAFGDGGGSTLTDIEKRAGVTAPTYASLRDAQGNLAEKYAYDPSKSAAFSQMREQAMAAPGESPWAKMQLQKQAMEQSSATDQAAKSALQGIAQQQSNMARFGGLGGGARERLASMGAKNLARSQQDVANQGIWARMGINENDINRKQDLLGKVGTEELQGQASNLGALRGDVQGQGQFDLNRYAQQMQAYGAEQTAKGQERAAQLSKPKQGLLGSLFDGII